MNILFFHQSADLYGSDRVLLTLVSKLNRSQFTPIVLLPVDGPLVKELRKIGVECHILPVVRLSRSTLNPRGLFSLAVEILRSLRAVNRVLQGRRIDIVHSNTLAVLAGGVWARLHGVQHVWHVHEIIESPILVRKSYALMLSWFADRVVCVSDAARLNLLRDRASLGSKSVVVWNGLNRDVDIDEDAVALIDNDIGVKAGEVVLALVGRINRWKGQRLLVAATTQLWQEGVQNLRVVFVGSVVLGQEHFLDDLRRDIDQSPARDCFVMLPFTPNVLPVWDACDVAVIPSTEPEPFGMVALEAMAASKPVIASRLGGLQEIVSDGKTGLLFKSGDARSLADAIKRLVKDSQARKQMGAAGLIRLRDEFLVTRFVERMTNVYRGVV